MANSMRWRYGDTNPVIAQVQSATVIEIGDLVWQDATFAKPAADLPDQGGEASNQSAFRPLFLGVAMQASPAGVTQGIRVATTGVFEFACDSTTFELGDLIGATLRADQAGLDSQKVAKTSAVANSIGRCAGRVAPAGPRVLVDLVSSVMKGGAQAVA